MASPALTKISQTAVRHGVLAKYAHVSAALGGLEARFNVFFPPSSNIQAKLPVLFWLSGLTCTENNFSEKAGAFRKAAQLGLVLVIPDTSPRGANVPGEKDSWDFGVGAGFYLNAIKEPWSKYWNMYDYIVSELPSLLEASFANLDFSRVSISGHSMGGHGALTIALKNPGKFKSASAFAPISHPSECPWGIKAFSGYLGEENKSLWAQYDATELAANYQGPVLPIRIDQGREDDFYKAKQLLPEHFEAAIINHGKESLLKLNMQFHDGYDHSYYFIQSFIDDHLEFHAEHLGLRS